MKRLYHIDIGDDDNLFMLAEDKQEVKRQIDEQGEFSSDMINSIVELPHIQELIEKQEREKIINYIESHINEIVELLAGYDEEARRQYHIAFDGFGKLLGSWLRGVDWQALKGEEVKE